MYDPLKLYPKFVRHSRFCVIIFGQAKLDGVFKFAVTII